MTDVYNLAEFSWGFPRMIGNNPRPVRRRDIDLNSFSIYSCYRMLAKYSTFFYLPTDNHRLWHFIHNTTTDEKKTFIRKLTALMELEYGTPDCHYYFDNETRGPIGRPPPADAEAGWLNMRFIDLGNRYLSNRWVGKFYPGDFEDAYDYLILIFEPSEVETILLLASETSSSEEEEESEQEEDDMRQRNMLRERDLEFWSSEEEDEPPRRRLRRLNESEIIVID